MSRNAPATDQLERARASFARHAWGEAYAGLSEADRAGGLDLEDLERLAIAAFLVGRDAESADTWARAHHDAVGRGDAPRAARCAFRIGFQQLNLGEVAQGLGWLARATRILEESGVDCVERGYLLVPMAIRALDEHDDAAAYARFSDAAAFAARFHDTELAAMAQYGRGRALVASGRTAEGIELIDEAMVAIAAGDVTPMVVGALYCSAIEAMRSIFDVRRAREWTATLSRWCESQPDLVPFRGQCLVYRAELMLLHGEWPDALNEARLACERLSAPRHPAAGAAFYQHAELRRLRGDLEQAEELYREASRLGTTPLPGLALLRLAQGQLDTARAALQRELEQSNDPAARAPLLAAYVEVLVAASEAQRARAAAVELGELAQRHRASVVEAMAAQATGAVLLGEGDARGAVAKLRQAWATWRDFEAPYDAARARLHLGLAYRALGDEEGAEMEFDAARSVFTELGAATDLARVDGLSPIRDAKPTTGLTPRELEVLTLLASGRTNRAIAAELVISEKTVARHVSNIFDKLGVSSRAGATAYAFQHGLV